MNNHLYIINVDLLSDEKLFRYYYEQSSEYRKKKIDALKFKKDKRLSLGAEMLLRKALMHEGIHDEKLVFNENGKPFLYGRNDVFFSISHSGSIAVCAISDRVVGVDIEQKHHFEESFRTDIFLPEEIVHILRNFNSPDQKFTELWTIKESIMKYFGTGLYLEPDKISISFTDMVRAEVNGYDAADLRFTQYPIQGYALTACSEYAIFTKEVEWIYS